MFEFRLSEVVVSFDGVSADGFGDHIICKSEPSAGGVGISKFVDDIMENTGRIVSFEKIGECIDFVGALAEGI